LKSKSESVIRPVPKLWPESTIVCIGCGPSLTQEDVDYCRGRARVIAVKDAWRLASWADALYACDGKYWDFYKGVPEFTGLKFGLTVDGRWPDVQALRNTGMDGLEVDPSGLRTGQNSGYQAVNLAVHLGARRIVLVGYDMQRVKGRAHFYGEHPPGGYQHTASPYGLFQQCFATIVEPLTALGIDLVNCSRQTALTCIPQQALSDALGKQARRCA
jgi:hypothetical protein